MRVLKADELRWVAGGYGSSGGFSQSQNSSYHSSYLSYDAQHAFMSLHQSDFQNGDTNLQDYTLINSSLTGLGLGDMAATVYGPSDSNASALNQYTNLAQNPQTWAQDANNGLLPDGAILHLSNNFASLTIPTSSDTSVSITWQGNYQFNPNAVAPEPAEHGTEATIVFWGAGANQPTKN